MGRQLEKRKSKHITILWVALFALGMLLIMTAAVIVLSKVPYFANTGQIGDTIGGLTAPIINLAGAILVFMSFREQVEANRIQWEKIEDENRKNKSEKIYNGFLQEFKELRDDTLNLKITIYDSGYRIDESVGYQEKPPTTYTYYGEEALIEFMNGIEEFANDERYAFLHQAAYVIANIQDLLLSVSNNTDITSEEKRNLILKINRFYISKYAAFVQGFSIRLKNKEEFKDIYAYFGPLMEGLMDTLENSLTLVGELYNKEQKRKI
jgi:hypothetical protein